MLRSVGHPGTFELVGLLLYLLVSDAGGPVQVGLAQIGIDQVCSAQVALSMPSGVLMYNRYYTPLSTKPVGSARCCLGPERRGSHVLCESRCLLARCCG